MCVEGVFSGEHIKQLNMVICEHLFRQGKLDVAERIVKVQQLLCGSCIVQESLLFTLVIVTGPYFVVHEMNGRMYPHLIPATILLAMHPFNDQYNP